jgi:hypothetical protein
MASSPEELAADNTSASWRSLIYRKQAHWNAEAAQRQFSGRGDLLEPRVRVCRIDSPISSRRSREMNACRYYKSRFPDRTPRKRVTEALSEDSDHTMSALKFSWTRIQRRWHHHTARETNCG